MPAVLKDYSLVLRAELDRGQEDRAVNSDPFSRQGGREARSGNLEWSYRLRFWRILQHRSSGMWRGRAGGSDGSQRLLHDAGNNDSEARILKCPS